MPAQVAWLNLDITSTTANDAPKWSDMREGIRTTQESQNWHQPRGEIGNNTEVLSHTHTQSNMGFTATTEKSDDDLRTRSGRTAFQRYPYKGV